MQQHPSMVGHECVHMTPLVTVVRLAWSAVTFWLVMPWDQI